jgi:hypothetical protein
MMAAQRNLLTGRYAPLPSSLSDGARAAVTGLLRVDPLARLTLEVSRHGHYCLCEYCHGSTTNTAIINCCCCHYYYSCCCLLL